MRIKLIGLFIAMGILIAACGGNVAPVSPLSPLSPMGQPTAAPASSPAAEAAQKALAQKLNVGLNVVKIVSVESVQWRDSCMGIQTKAMCLQVITPGYKVVLEANGTSYEYHTNQNGSNVLLASPGG